MRLITLNPQNTEGQGHRSSISATVLRTIQDRRSFRAPLSFVHKAGPRVIQTYLSSFSLPYPKPLRRENYGHPLKGPLSRNKLPRSRKANFFLTRDNVRIYLHACDKPPLSASVISLVLCRHYFTAPVIHQDQGLS